MSFDGPVADLLMLTLRTTRRDHVSKLVLITMGRWRKARTCSHHAAQCNAQEKYACRAMSSPKKQLPLQSCTIESQ